MKRITINLLDDEGNALLRLASLEKRHPRQQAALLVRRQLILSGFLDDETPEPQTNSAEVTDHESES